MRFLGSLLLGIWRVRYRLRGLLHLQFQYDHGVMSALARVCLADPATVAETCA